MADRQCTIYTIYTVGHSNTPVEELARLLQGRQVQVLVDVRSSPYSKYAVHFNREALLAHPALAEAQIRYLYAGKWLGGRPDGLRFYDDEGYVRYDLLAQSPTFRDGITRLFDLASQLSVALMCSEEDPTHCHRRLLLGRVLAEEGVMVRHLRADGHVQLEEDLAREETSGQLGLFAELEEKPWRSARSVLPTKAPPSSSDSSERPESSGW